jgi:hypothetical protein
MYEGLNVNYHHSCQISIEFSRQIFEKYSCVKFYGNPSSEGRAFGVRTEGPIDKKKKNRHDEANIQSLFVKLRTRLITIIHRNTDIAVKPISL